MSDNEVERETLPYKKWYRPDFSLRNLIIIALFGVLGIILTLYSIPLPFPVPGLGTMSFGLQLVPPYLIGMTLGPIPAILVEFIQGIGFDLRFGTFPVFIITSPINAPSWWTLVWWFTGMRNPKYRKLWVVIALNLIFTFAWLKLTLAFITFPIFLKIPVESAINSLYILPGGWLKGSISAVIDAVVVWLIYSRKEVRKILGLNY
jgi:riboflavin transporter FmnP